MPAPVIIISGPSGAGKSSVALALCERYDRTVHIETDAYFAAIQMGRVNPMRPASARQNLMVARAVARAASAYAEDLFTVFIDGVIGPHLLPVYVEELAPRDVQVHFALLMPPLDVTLDRVAARHSRRRLEEQAHRDLYAQFERYGNFAGRTLDTAGLTPDQSADAVMQLCGEGACLVAPAGR